MAVEKPRSDMGRRLAKVIGLPDLILERISHLQSPECRRNDMLATIVASVLGHETSVDTKGESPAVVLCVTTDMRSHDRGYAEH